MGEVKDQGFEHGAGTMIINSKRFSDEEKEKILYRNIFELLGPRVKSMFNIL